MIRILILFLVILIIIFSTIILSLHFHNVNSSKRQIERIYLIGQGQFIIGSIRYHLDINNGEWPSSILEVDLTATHDGKPLPGFDRWSYYIPDNNEDENPVILSTTMKDGKLIQVHYDGSIKFDK